MVVRIHRVATAGVAEVVSKPVDRKRLGGLVLTRRLGQSLIVGDSVEVEVVGIRSGAVKLRIVAPAEISIHRREVYDSARMIQRSATAGLRTPRIGGSGGLVLTRYEGESIMIGDSVELFVDDVRPGAAGIRIVAPREVRVDRREVHESIRRDGLIRSKD